MIQPHNRYYPSYGAQPQPYGVVMNQQPQQQAPQQKNYNNGNVNKSETRKAIDHYSYALNEEIGRGFSSKVYKGRDENNQQPVAVKVIDMKMVKQSIHSVLLKNEISALKSFNSVNILQLYDVFQTQNNTYLITEYCDSGDLSNRIKRRGRIDEAESVRILKDIVQGLNEINQKGFIHRDIKPANILINGVTPKIADFGFAVLVNSNDSRSQGKNFNVGTPLYMSPQALRQQGHNEKGDVWAIGVMFFEMIYGRPPFSAQSEAALLSNILHQGLSIPANPPVSEVCKDFIRRCLQVDEGRRFRVKEMASHSLVVQDKIMRLPSANQENEQFQFQQQQRGPLREIQLNQQQKEKRSHSQGVKDQRPIRSDNILNKKNEVARPPTSINTNIFLDAQRIGKRTPTDITNLQIDTRDLVARSKSQKQMLDVKNISKVQKNVQDCPSPSYIRRQQSFEQPHESRRAAEKNKNNLTVNDVKIAPQPKTKNYNNEILFSQINFSRFLYKFSQSLMQVEKYKLTSEVREKLLFIIAKNIFIKINKLSLLNEKENFKDNIFQLQEYETYKKSESFQKFSQAIYEYNEKYKKHFEKIYVLVQKNGLTSDKKFEVIFDRDFNEFESFYFVAQSFIKQAILEINIDEGSIVDNQFSMWIVENLLDYNNLINHLSETQGDYRKFQRAARVELIVDRKQRKYSSRDAQELIQRINQLQVK